MDLKNGFLDLNGDDYYLDKTHISHSSMEVFRSSIKRYRDYYVDQTKTAKETESLLIGRAIHCMVFESSVFPLRWMKMPEFLPNKSGKEKKEKFIKNNPGVNFLTESQYEQVLGMGRSIISNSSCYRLLSVSGFCERPIQWQCPLTGLWCKAKLDFFSNKNPSLDYIVDLKSISGDVSDYGFRRDCLNYGYHRQAYWYRWGFRIAFGVDIPFYFAVVSKDDPFESRVFDLEPNFYSLAKKEVEADLHELAVCRELDFWESRGQNEITTLKLKI